MIGFGDPDTHQLKLHQHSNLVVSGKSREISDARNGILDK
jgi:hypothetical protein